ncbi:MAG: MBL fold metallo-hydrolase RNA specificity domain-containing protein [Lachnospiraceae bacterium]
MKLTFVGAAHEVTGSCHFLEAAGKKILVDYGMEQGFDIFENIPIPVAPADIDFVLLTHAHIDHSGCLPVLSQYGFAGEILATDATCDLAEIMLRDSAGIQEFEAEWRGRRDLRQGREPYTPFYTSEDVERILKYFRSCPYGEILEIAPGLRVRFTDVGHLLGSAAIEVWAKEDGREVKLLFSGDIGNNNQPLIKDPDTIDEADYVIMESTYGDRSHDERTDYVTAFAEVIQRTFERGGNVVVPSFAVGRTQEMLYFIRQIKEQKRVRGFEDFEVYVDSPLAIRATNIFSEHTWDCFDDEARELLANGIDPIRFPGLRIATTAEESKAINEDRHPKVIISASGMCEAGRIKHHLKHNLWRPESTILFVGYQAQGTLGRRLLDGADEVTLFHEQISVRAEICQLPGVSGHADREGLIAWAGALKNPPKRCFIVHGEDKVTDTFAETLAGALGWKTYAPYSGTVYDLLEDAFVRETYGIPIGTGADTASTEEPARNVETQQRPRKKKTQDTYRRLLAAAERLLAMARRSDGLANKDMARFADQITSLCDKWE